MGSGSPSKHKVLVSYTASAIEVLYFCSWDEEYVSELVVSDCMHQVSLGHQLPDAFPGPDIPLHGGQGRAFSMLKKVCFPCFGLSACLRR